MTVSSDCRWCHHSLHDHRDDDWRIGPCHLGKCGCLYWEGSDAWFGEPHWDALQQWWAGPPIEEDICADWTLSMVFYSPGPTIEHEDVTSTSDVKLLP